jgi:hypothetical protein
MASGDQMSEVEKAIVRACLEQVELALHEARDVPSFWEKLGSDVRMRWCDFQADVHAIKHGLKDDRATT